MMAPLLPGWTVVFGFVLGAFFGSFLNMVIYRLPREGLSFGEPKRSFCPECKHPLDWIDLIPLGSWLSTGGKCRYCHKPISVRYFIVEMLTGLVWAGIWWQFMAGRPSPDLATSIAYGVASLALIAIIFIDAELYIIPDELNALLLFVGLIFGVATHQIVHSVEGALLGWGIIWGFALLGRLAFGKDAMGDGDIKMMRGVGALIFPLLVLANLAIGVILGLIGGLAGMAYAARAKGAAESKASESDADPEEPPMPTPIWVVLLSGLWYLLCLDVVGLVYKPLDKWIVGKLPAEVVEEEDDWKPSATTIPFGPYLAAGAMVCLLFGAAIEKGMKDYWRNATGGHDFNSLSPSPLGRTPFKEVVGPKNMKRNVRTWALFEGERHGNV